MIDRHGVYLELFNRVVHGEYLRGEWLREDRLAQEFHVSRTPVREAFFELAKDGLAESVPNRGFRSLGFTVDDLEEAYEIRRVLEILALERAIHTLSIQELQEIRKQIVSAGTIDDAREHARIDSELHGLIVESARSPRLSAILGSLSRIMQSFRELGFRDEVLRKRAQEEHLRLIDALASRDITTAAELLDRHIKDSKPPVLIAVLDGIRPTRDRRHLTLSDDPRAIDVASEAIRK